MCTKTIFLIDFRFAVLPLVLLCTICNPRAVRAQSDELARLIHPAVAERLSLDDAQRTQLQQLLLARAEQLAQAQDAAAKQAVIGQFSERILAVLTDAQRAQLNEDVPQQKLMFQFREMKWDEVLDWFAKQQDLTLVMDRTPAGTFTYSDNRAYSAAEGIDLLNSVLLTRGFTLVRREKMLVVMELNDSIPLELIPRVPLEQLSERGKFELVSVLFPLAGRPVDTVLNEVKPYLSNFGRVVPLARGGQLLVIETAGKMSTINELIAAVPVPQQPKADKPAPKPEPVFTAYPLGELDSRATLETIKKLIPSEQITVDAKTGLLSAFVIPAQQVAIKSALEQMAQQTSNRTTVSTAYRYTGIKPEEVVAQITALVPAATVTATAERVLVTATADEQQKISAALAALNIQATSGEREFQIFQVDAAGVTTLGSTLQKLLVNSTVVTNPANGTLLVQGSSRDLQLASQAIEMWQKVDVTDQLQLSSFELERRGDAAWLAQVSRLVPNATAWLAEDGRRVILLGKPQDAVALEAALPELIRLLPAKDERQLKFYQLSESQLARRASLAELPSELSNLKLVDGNRGELMVWGTAQQQAAFAELLAQLDKPVPTPLATYPKLYPLNVRDPATLTKILTSEFPRVQFSVNPAGTELTVVAHEELHPQIAQRLQSLSEQLPTRGVETLESYSVSGMTAAALQQILAPLLQTARATIDAERNRLMVWGAADKHAELAQMVAALGEAPDVSQQKVIIAYPLKHATASSAKTLLDQMVRDALVLADDRLKQVVVTGTLETQALVKAAVAQMDRAGAEREPTELRSYDVGKFQATTLLSALQPMWPELQLSVDTSANKIIAAGPPTAHAELLATLDRLLAAPGGKQQSVQTYPVPAGEMNSLPSILAQIAPQALISSDPASRTVTVWATDELHARIAQAIEKISQAAQSANEPATYLFKPSQLNAAQTSLRTLFPSIGLAGDFSTGQLIVVAPASVQQQVAQIVELIHQGPNAADNSLAVLQVDPQRTNLSSLLTALQSTTPAQVRLEANADGKSILAIGTTEDLNQVRQRFAQLVEQLPPLPTTSSRVYELQHTTASSVVSVLAALLPGVPLAQDPSQRAFVATAREADHAKVVELLRAFDIPRAPTGRSVQTYSLPFGEMSSMSSLIVQLAPQAVVSSDLANRTLTIWTDAESHARIEQALQKVSQAAEQATLPTSYAVRPAQIPTVQTALRSLFPSLGMSADSTTGQLVIIASPDMHKRIAEVVELLSNGPGAEERTLALLQVPPDKASMSEVLAALQSLSPAQVSLTSSATNNSILAIGLPGDLEKVRQQFDKVVAEIPPPEQRTSQVYQLLHASPSAAISLLANLIPQATFAQDPTTRTVGVTAKPREHERIAEFLKAFDLPRQSNMLTRVYRLTFGSARGLQLTLNQLIPEATIYGSREAGVLIVTATPEQHERIAAIIEEADSERPTSQTRVFNLTSGNVSSLVNAINGFAPEATVSGDQASNSLIVTATEAELKRIETMVEQIESGNSDHGLTKFYPLTGAEPLPLATALKRSFPRATFAADASSGGLFVTTSAEEHLDLAKVIDDLNAQPTKRPSLRSFAIEHANPELVAEALQTAFGRRSTAGITFNRETRSLFVVGDRDELQVAEQLIEQIDVAQAAERARQVKSFALNGISGNSVMRAIEGLFRDRGQEVDMQYDVTGQQLLVTADEEQLRIIEQALHQFAPPKRELKILQLGTVDPYSFKLAVETLFEDEPLASAPSLTIDEDGPQVLVRATPEQLQSIGELLQQMGEPALSDIRLDANSSTTDARIRFIPMVRQSNRLLDELQRLWPAVGDNPLRIIQPGEPTPSAPPPSDSPAPQTPAQDNPPVPDAPSPLSQGDDGPSANPAAVLVGWQQSTAQTPTDAGTTAPPIVIVTGNNRWTLASEDTAALAQLQRLLEMLASPKMEPFATTGNFSIYLLQHAGAADIEDMLSDLFRPSVGRSGVGSSLDNFMRRVKIVADSRINALIVSGNHSDRQTIEDLLGVLDSEDLIDTLQQITPTLLTLRSASASHVEDVLRDVYRTQLSQGAGRRPIAIPEGITSEVALLLQQINAQTTGPLLTIAVDETTNSLIMRAPPQLIREIQSFVLELDQQSGRAPSSRVDLIRLKSTNTENLEAALRLLMGRRN